jgi:hypothetical protein
MTTSYDITSVSQEQTIQEYFADLNTKPTAALTRADLLWLAEGLHQARHFFTLLPNDEATTANCMNRLFTIECQFEEVVKVFGATTIQNIYDEVESLHEGEPPLA